MPIEIINITTEERNLLLKEQEDHFLDFKSINISPAKLTETLSAFANADGGELYIGIAEKGRRRTRIWQGFSNQEAANGHIQALEGQFPLGQYFSYDFISCEDSNGLLLRVNVHKTLRITKATNGTAYIRRGAQSIPVNNDTKLRQLELSKGIATYETEIVPVELDVIKDSPILQRFLSNIVPSPKSLDFLRKQFLIQEGTPTVAAILLFAELPQAILPKHCGIKIYRYKTRDAKGARATLAFDPLSVEGCVYDCIYKAVDKTVEIVEDIPILGIGGLESISYPRVTLHEIITNAVLHRDYSIRSDIDIRIFDNRIEVESPGRLPGHITVQNILRERFARNGSIIRMLIRFPNPPNKDIGEGLNTAFEAMRQLKLKEPEITESDNSVTVYIRHERLASPEDAVIQYLENHDEINNSKARELTGITSENSMKQVFYRLRKQSLIERVPNKHGPKSAWRKSATGQLKLFE